VVWCLVGGRGGNDEPVDGARGGEAAVDAKEAGDGITQQRVVRVDRAEMYETYV
jgi:hypothetical protein